MGRPSTVCPTACSMAPQALPGRRVRGAVAVEHRGGGLGVQQVGPRRPLAPPDGDPALRLRAQVAVPLRGLPKPLQTTTVSASGRSTTSSTT